MENKTKSVLRKITLIRVVHRHQIGVSRWCFRYCCDDVDDDGGGDRRRHQFVLFQFWYRNVSSQIVKMNSTVFDGDAPCKKRCRPLLELIALVWLPSMRKILLAALERAKHLAAPQCAQFHGFVNRNHGLQSLNECPGWMFCLLLNCHQADPDWSWLAALWLFFGLLALSNHLKLSQEPPPIRIHIWNRRLNKNLY